MWVPYGIPRSISGATAKQVVSNPFEEQTWIVRRHESSSALLLQTAAQIRGAAHWRACRFLVSNYLVHLANARGSAYDEELMILLLLSTAKVSCILLHAVALFAESLWKNVIKVFPSLLEWNAFFPWLILFQYCWPNMHKTMFFRPRCESNFHENPLACRLEPFWKQTWRIVHAHMGSIVVIHAIPSTVGMYAAHRFWKTRGLCQFN